MATSPKQSVTSGRAWSISASTLSSARAFRIRPRLLLSVELNIAQRQAERQLGPAVSAEMANKPGDVTHFNEKGARAMADLVMSELTVALPKIKDDLKETE